MAKRVSYWLNTNPGKGYEMCSVHVECGGLDAALVSTA